MLNSLGTPANGFTNLVPYTLSLFDGAFNPIASTTSAALATTPINNANGGSSLANGVTGFARVQLGSPTGPLIAGVVWRDCHVHRLDPLIARRPEHKRAGASAPALLSALTVSVSLALPAAYCRHSPRAAEA